MLVLSETPIGFVVFKLGNDYKLDSKDLWKEFETPEKANKAYVFFVACITLMLTAGQAQGRGHPALHLHCLCCRGPCCHPGRTSDRGSREVYR